MFGRLRTAQPRIENDSVSGNAGTQQRFDPGPKFRYDMVNDNLVTRLRTHRLAVRSPMRCHKRNTPPGDDGSHGGIGQAAADVIDMARPCSTAGLTSTCRSGRKTNPA
jgi:hypothetical protein